MRLQKYVKPFEYDGRGFFYSQIHSLIFEVPYSVYLSAKKGEFEKIKEEKPDIYSFFVSRNVIVPDDFKEEEFLNLLVRQSAINSNKNQKIVVIAPSLDCNLKCIYCFEEDTGTKKPVVMNKEIADKVVKYIENWVSPQQQLEISWYGGEPLIAADMIYYISQKLKNGKFPNFTAAITTNGFLLTEKVAKMLQESNVTGGQITVDGPKEIHDKKRPAKAKGVSSYDVIVKNIIDNAKYFQHLTFRANLDKDNKDIIYAYWEDMRKVLPNNVSFGFERVSATDSPYISEKAKKRAMSDKEWAEFLKRNPTLYSFHILETSYGCGAVRDNMIVIDANGDLFRCWNEVGQHDKAVGNVVDGITNWDRYMRYSNISLYDIHEDCRNCFLVASCFGGHCPRRILFPEEFGTPYTCNAEKFVLDDFLIQAILKNDPKIIPVGVPRYQQSRQSSNVNLVVNKQASNIKQPYKKETVSDVFRKSFMFYAWLFNRIGAYFKSIFSNDKQKIS